MPDDDFDIEDPMDRAESVAREFLGVSAQEAFEMLDRGELPEGSVAETELQAIRWLLR